jgi:hypothetical protein
MTARSPALGAARAGSPGTIAARSSTRRCSGSRRCARWRAGRVYDAQLPLAQRRIKRACRALVNSVGTQTEAADILGMKKDGQRRISELVSANCPDSLTLFQAIELEEEARGAPDWPQVTRAMARHHDFELLPLAERAAGVVDWHRGMGEVSKEAAEVVQKALRALADDNRVTAREIRDHGIIEEIEEAIAKLANLRAMARASAEADE